MRRAIGRDPSAPRAALPRVQRRRDVLTIRQEVVDRIPEALVAVLRDPAAIGPRSVIGDVPLDEFAERAVRRTTDRLITARAIELLRGTATPDHPIQILLSAERATFAVSHAWMDGLGMAELIGAVMAVAAGGSPRLDTRTPVRYPLVRGLRAVGVGGVVDFVRARRTTPVVGPEVADGTSPRRSVSIELPIEPELFARIERLDGKGRATPAARLASVAIGALARVHRRDVDVPVAVPVSLLRHVGNRRVLGNFIGIEPLGTLHASNWSPDAITRHLVDAARSGRAMVGLVYAVVRAARYALIPGRATQSHSRVAVSMQIIALPKLFPDSAWATDEWRTCAATIGPWPSSTALAPFRMGKLWGVSAWDESGDFDLEALPDALIAEVEAREAAAAEASR